MSRQTEEKKKDIIKTCIASGINLFLLISFFIFIYGFGGDSPISSSTKPQGDKYPGTISFTSNVYEIETNQEMDMSKYLKKQGIKEKDIVWGTDSPNLIVGSKGHVLLNNYDSSGILTASSKKNPAIKAKCTIQTRSKQDDMIYQIESLNGEHVKDELTSDGITQLAYSKKNNEIINVSKQNINPKKRNTAYKWDKKLFYTLEEIDPDNNNDGKINSYHIKKKKFVNQDTGNDIEYEIYHHPNSGKINKIVSIEFKEKILEITEYYYTNEEKLNFVYAYYDVNYTPSYATPTRDGERYLFHKDTMVTWRIVKNRTEVNYCYGKAESKRLEGDEKPNIKEYSEFNDERKTLYDQKEKEILNAAYNTLEKVKNSEGVSTISGYLKRSSGDSLEKANVKLKSVEHDLDLYCVSTNAEGYYEILVPLKASDYSLKFMKDGYSEEILYGIETNDEAISLNQEVVYLADNDLQKYECELEFYDALNKNTFGEGMAALNNLDIMIRRGVNNKSGTVLYEKHISESNITLELESGMYTVQMSKAGYTDTYSSLFVSKDSKNSLSIYATPELKENEYRIVLTWDNHPGDLDSHLFAPSSYGNYEDYHICFYNMTDSNNNTSLDVDDADGYGPETITINKLQNGQYKFYVCDYTNCSQGNEGSYDMSNSSATIKVYEKKGLIQTFFVPVNQKGVIWEVFEIRDGIIIPSQRYYDAIGNKTWWQTEK